MPFTARRSSTCATCQKPIVKDRDTISWHRATGQAWHFACGKPSNPKTENEMETEIETVEAPTTNGNGHSGEEHAAKAIVALLAGLSGPKVDESMVRRIVQEEVVKTVRTLEVRVLDHAPVTLATAHKDLETLIKLVSTLDHNGHRLNVYLYGPAGSGKSTGAHQSATALGLAYYYISLCPQTSDSRLVGYMDATGKYVPGILFKPYTEGGTLCLDEIDNASASLVTTLNSCLANGSASFPHGIFPRHKDFVCVCTANTIGRGADIRYPERRLLDSAFLERFCFMEWAYDTSLTAALAAGISGGVEEATKLIAWVDKEGDELQKRFPSLVVSPRATIQGATLQKAGFDKAFIRNAVIARGVK